MVTFQSIVVAITKKNNYTHTIDNLRPISLLPVLSKILLKLMKQHLVTFLKKYNFFSRNQFGFTAGKSTEGALSEYVENIYNKINEGNKVASIFIDFRKSLGLVNYNLLMEKMERAGIRGISLIWFHSLLSGREQSVKINDSVSDLKIITKKGIPQVSVLSPTLIIILINYLFIYFRGKFTVIADTMLTYSHIDKGKYSTN